MESDERRLMEAEFLLKEHGERITTMENKIALLHQDLGEMMRILINIKWWLAGVGSFYIIQQVGLMPFIKKFIGL